MLLTEHEVVVEQSVLPVQALHSQRWLQAVPHLDPKHGGLSAVVPQLAENLTRQANCEIELATFEASPNPSTNEQFDFPVTEWPSSRLRWMRDEQMHSRLQQTISGCDGVHIHGLWTNHASLVARSAKQVGVPYVVSAHGMLEPWALKQKALKKAIYTALIERRTLREAACLHALTLAEAGDYRRFGYKGPIAVIPNAVSEPVHSDPSAFLARFTELQHKRIILFLGRLHPKKGVEILLQAWQQIASKFEDAVLVLAGPQATSADEAKWRTLAERTGQVVFTGMLDAPLKWSALSAAEVFVLPSYSEGLSVAILEALSMACPVLISEPCHMPEVAAAGAGWSIEPTVQNLTAAMLELLNNTPEANASIGRRGRQLFESRFTWTTVATQMAELYAWVQGGSKPTTFELMEAIS